VRAHRTGLFALSGIIDRDIPIRSEFRAPQYSANLYQANPAQLKTLSETRTPRGESQFDVK